MYKKERCTCKLQVVFLQNIPYTRYPKKYFTQIYRDLYGDAMLVPTWMGTNMADGNQQKHLLPSIGTKEYIYSSRNSYSYKMAQDYK